VTLWADKVTEAQSHGALPGYPRWAPRARGLGSGLVSVSRIGPRFAIWLAKLRERGAHDSNVRQNQLPTKPYPSVLLSPRVPHPSRRAPLLLPAAARLSSSQPPSLFSPLACFLPRLSRRSTTCRALSRRQSPGAVPQRSGAWAVRSSGRRGG
jgi:hypothetical protein